MVKVTTSHKGQDKEIQMMDMKEGVLYEVVEAVEDGNRGDIVIRYDRNVVVSLTYPPDYWPNAHSATIPVKKCPPYFSVEITQE